MFSPASQALTNPCLPPLFSSTYTSFAGLFAMMSALSVQFIQTIAVNHFSSKTKPVRTHCHESHASLPRLSSGSHAHEGHVHVDDGRQDFAHECRAHMDGFLPEKRPNLLDTCGNSFTSKPPPQFDRLIDNNADFPSDFHSHNESDASVSQSHPNNHGNLLLNRPSDHKHHADLPHSSTLQSAIREKSSTVELAALQKATNIHSDSCCDVDHFALMAGDHNHRQITAYILELGIATHSIIIGLTLGITTGPEFQTLLVAIVFHQFFEGFALSTTGFTLHFPSFDSICMLY